MKNFRKIFLFLLFSSVATISFSQTVLIVEDFQNCGTGLKDSATGKWILEPIYQEIRDLGFGYYRVLSGSKEGIVNSKGQIIVPAVYDYTDLENYYPDSVHVNSLFSIENGKYIGIMNSSGKFIVPLSCRYAHVNDDGSIIAEVKRKKYVLYFPDGNSRSFKGKLPESPDYLGDHILRVSRNAFGLTSGYYWFLPQIKRKYGVINDSMRTIIPKKYSEIYYSNYNYKLIEVRKNKKIGYYSNSGKLIWTPVFKFDYGSDYYNEWGSYTPQLSSDGYAEFKLKNKFGIIGANGDTLLPFIYQSIEFLRNNDYHWNGLDYLVSLNGMDGIYRPSEKKWILPLEYDYLRGFQNYSVKNDLDAVSVLLASKNGKYGLISTSGQEILPIVYDDFYLMSHGIIFKSGEQLYAVTFPECTKPPMEASTYVPAYDVLSPVVEELPANKLLKKIVRPDSTILFVNPDFISDSTQKSYYYQKLKSSYYNKETYDSLIHATAIVITPLKKISDFNGIGPAYIFPATDLTISYNAYSTSEFCFIKNPDESRYNKYSRIEPIQKIGYDSLYNYFELYNYGFYRSDGKIILQENKNWYHHLNQIATKNGLAIFSVQTRGKEGLMNGNGKILVDTIWYDIGDMSGNYIWVKKKRERIFSSEYTWNILDTTTNQLLLTKKQRSYDRETLGQEGTVVERPEGPKLFVYKTRQFVLNENVNSIEQLDDEGYFYSVRTCSGKIGIIGSDGKWLADTVWTTLICASNDSVGERYYYYNNRNVNNSYNYSVLSNDTGWIIFDGKNKRLTKDPETINYLLAKAENSFSLDSNTYRSQHNRKPEINKFCYNCPSWYVDKDVTSKELRPWQSNLLFDSLFTGETFIPDTDGYYFVYSCKECLKRKVRHNFDYEFGKNYDRTVLNHTVRFVNDSVISVTRENLSRSYSYDEYPSDIFFTVMLFNDGPHGMLLDSLFTGTEWKKFITIQVMNYLDSGLYITGNCSNPYMMPFVMKNRFTITEDGILFFPPGYRENGNQLAIFVSWEKLRPYLRKDVISKLGIMR